VLFQLQNPLFFEVSTGSPYLNGAQVCSLLVVPYVGAVLAISLRGVEFHCTPDQLGADGACPITTGEQVLQLYNLDVSTMAYALGMLACLLIYRILAYVLLRLKLMHWKLEERETVE
jgi:hypothetical protein